MYLKDINIDQAEELLQIAKTHKCLTKTVYDAYLHYFAQKADHKVNMRRNLTIYLIFIHRL